VGPGAAGVVAGIPPPAGNAEATWLNDGAAEVQPCGTERAPSDAARPDTAVTGAPPNAGELPVPTPGPAPMSSDDLNIGKPPPKALLAEPKVFPSDADEPSIDTPDVSIDADEAVPDARLAPDASAVLDDDVEVVSDASGDVDDEDVTVDARACRALGIAAELSGESVCAPVPADVPAAWVTAAASPATPDELVLSGGVVKGANNDAADDAPA
jgi:hypothetical protein